MDSSSSSKVRRRFIGLGNSFRNAMSAKYPDIYVHRVAWELIPNIYSSPKSSSTWVHLYKISYRLSHTAEGSTVCIRIPTEVRTLTDKEVAHVFADILTKLLRAANRHVE